MDLPGRAAARYLPLRFSLRTGMLALTAVALFLGLYVVPAFRQRKVVEALEQGCFSVYYSRDRNVDGGGEVPYPPLDHELYVRNIREDWWNQMVNGIGIDLFYSPEFIRISPTEYTPVARESMELVKQLPTVTAVSIYADKVIEDDIRVLAALPKLRSLDIRQGSSNAAFCPPSLRVLKKVRFLRLDYGDSPERLNEVLPDDLVQLDLFLQGYLKPAHVQAVVQRRSLRNLAISFYELDRRGNLSHLAELTKLQELSLAPVYLDDLTPLRSLPDLKVLDIGLLGRRSDADELRKRFPHCRINVTFHSDDVDEIE